MSAEPITARGIVRRGLRASSPNGAAASKPMKARIANTIPLKVPSKVPTSLLWGLKVWSVRSPVFDRIIQSDSATKTLIEDAEQDADVGGQAHVAVGEEEDDRCGDQDPDPPLACPVPAHVRSHDVGRGPGEDQEEERRDGRLEENEDPPDHEPDGGAERAAHVGVEPAGRRHLLGQLANRVRDEQAGDEGDEDGKRQRGPRELDRYEDRERDRRTGSHVRDRLEEGLRQADRVLAQVVEGAGCRRRLGVHRFTSSRMTARPAMISKGAAGATNRESRPARLARAPS
jgi:hypothetical protein